ncbi:hypothetical protein ACJEQ8_44895, partial [Klebsiella pneumoniae]
MCLCHFYTFFTPHPRIFAKSLRRNFYPPGKSKTHPEVDCDCRRTHWRWAGVPVTGLSGLCLDTCGGILMAAQGFLLLASYLLVLLVLARPLGMCLA